MIDVQGIFVDIRDLSEISRGGGGRGGGGVRILNLGPEIRWPTHAMGVKFDKPPLELGLKYHDPPHLTELNQKCSRLFKVQRAFQAQANTKKEETKTK